MLKFDELFIGGKWIKPRSTEVLSVVSPSTEQVIGSVPMASNEDLDLAVAAARKAFDQGPWPHLSGKERAACLRRIADGLIARRADFSSVLADEAGLPVTLWGNIDGALGQINHAADLVESYSFEEHRQGKYANVLVRQESIGVVGAILPWNSPLSIGFMKLAPALAAGCTVVFKPAPETPLHAFLLAEVLRDIGLPDGVVNILPGGRAVSQALVCHPGIDKVSFTGSTATGRIVAGLCGERLKRCSLELGGKSAAIVLEDVVLPEVLGALVGAATMNNGEACVLQSRILAPRSRYHEISDALAQAFSRLTVGDPHAPESYIGPLISDVHRGKVEGYIASGVHDGARIVVGGGRPSDLRSGWYIEPTVLADATNEMRFAREEIFAPVVSLIPYDDEVDAVAIANDTPYGLSGTVWTGDPEHGLAIAANVRAGNYGVNTFGMETCAPFGGYKESGIGREMGHEGFEEFLQSKSVHMPLSVDEEVGA